MKKLLFSYFDLNFSISSIHNRVLLRCGTNYEEADETEKSNAAARYSFPCYFSLNSSPRCFVVVTSVLTLIGITLSFWLKNFSPYSQQFH